LVVGWGGFGGVLGFFLADVHKGGDSNEKKKKIWPFQRKIEANSNLSKHRAWGKTQADEEG